MIFKRFLGYIKKEPLLPVAVIAAVISLFVTPPSSELLTDIDWRTLATLFLMLTVLEGFKQENIFAPILRIASGIRTSAALAFFLVFSVFFTSMFVTNDVSLIIFVPLTIILFRASGKEKYILPLLALENIAAVRGSLLTPFGSPQNLFIFGKSGVSASRFISYMAPICGISGVLLIVFIIVIFRKEFKKTAVIPEESFPAKLPRERRVHRIVFIFLFLIVVTMIVSRTQYWYIFFFAVSAALLVLDRRIFLKSDYVLIVTFFCFFVFSSSVSRNPAVASFLSGITANHEYATSIIVSQLISNVPAAIVLFPFAENRGALLYGLDSAGLVSLIGSLASVINYRIYVREYPGKGLKFIGIFTLICLIFFLIVMLPGYFISKIPL